MDNALGLNCTEANGTAICGEDLSCAFQPGATEGYCTVMGCSSMSTPCPPGYSCFALADACLKQ